jgi:MFS family permease
LPSKSNTFSALSWTPFVICAVIGTILAAWLVPRLDAQWILAIGIVAIIGSCLLMATLVNSTHSYWPQVFPSVTLFAFSPDLVYTAAQIIASSSVQRKHQGTAASLISVLNLYGGSLGLGFAGTIESQLTRQGRSRILGFRSAFYFGIGISVVALIVDVLFIRSEKNKKKGWDEGDLASLMEEEMVTMGTSTGVEREAVQAA